MKKRHCIDKESNAQAKLNGINSAGISDAQNLPENKTEETLSTESTEKNEKIDYEQLLETSISFAKKFQECGAETYRVEESIERIIKAYGINKVDTFVIPSSIMASLETDDGKVFTKLRRIKASDTNMDGIEKYNDLSRKICVETPPLKKFKRMVDETTARIVNYSKLTIYLANIIVAVGFAVFFGGNFADALCSGLCGLATGLCMNSMGTLNVNPFFKTFVSGFILSFLAQALTALGLCMRADAVTIGPIMLLVPGFLFTNSLRDIIGGDTMSGVNRLVQVVIIATAMVVGTGAGVSLAKVLWKLPEPVEIIDHSLLIQTFVGVVGTFGFCLILNIHGSGMALCLLGGAFSWLAYKFCVEIGISENISYLIASACVSFYAEIIARVRKYPAISYLLASLVPLIPGAGIYYTMSFAVSGDMNAFLNRGAATAAIAVSLAAGVLLVSTIFRMWGVWHKRRISRNSRTAN